MSMRERAHPYQTWPDEAAELPSGDASAAECDCGATIRELLLEIAGMGTVVVLVSLIAAQLS